MQLSPTTLAAIVEVILRLQFIIHFKLAESVPTDTIQEIKRLGYPAETHEVTTEDGYILQLHRIPNNSSMFNPVLLISGDPQSSSAWVSNRPVRKSFAYILADNGFDVWLGNHRGNWFSRKHVLYSLDSNQFWDFGIDETAMFDVPAMIDYVLNSTRAKKLHHISYSLSTATMLAGISLRPMYNSKLCSITLYAPRVYSKGMFYGILPRIAPYIKILLIGVQKTFGWIPIISHGQSDFLTWLGPRICSPKIDIFGLCFLLLHFLFGEDGGIITQDHLANILKSIPSSTSLKTWMQCAQQWQSNQFAALEYGENKLNKWQITEYNLSSVTAPVAIFAGVNDIYSTVQDSKELGRKLLNLCEFCIPSYGKFSHLHFQYGGYLAEKVYNTTVRFLRNFDSDQAEKHSICNNKNH